MNTSQLIEAVAAQTKLSTKDTALTLTTVLNVIRRTVATGDAVRLSHFGMFQARHIDDKDERNPQAGDPVSYVKVVKFLPEEAFRAEVNHRS